MSVGRLKKNCRGGEGCGRLTVVGIICGNGAVPVKEREGRKRRTEREGVMYVPVRQDDKLLVLVDGRVRESAFGGVVGGHKIR